MPRDVRIRLRLGQAPPDGGDEAALRELAARELRVDPASFGEVRLHKVSLDARRKTRGWDVLLRVWESDEELPQPIATTPPRHAQPPSDAPTVLVVGSGPAGLWCALDLVAAGLRPIVLERGHDVRARRRSIRAILRNEHVDPDSNYCFGEGGAGTYSDGKLYTRSGNKRAIRGVLEDLVAHGAPPEILWSWRPHVGSNRLPEVVAAMRASIQAGGGEVRFRTRVEELLVEDGRVRGVVARGVDSDERLELSAAAVVLATGHSAPDVLAFTARAGAQLEPKGFAMGVRIEHPQPWLDERQYDGARERAELPASFYELTTQAGGRGVYSFCMCPGGFIVPATTHDERVVVNGMSLSRRDSPFANSGLVVAVEPEDWCGERGREWGWRGLLRRDGVDDPRLPASPDEDPRFGVRLQEALERLAARAGGGQRRAPSQRADHVLAGRGRSAPALATSFRPGLTPVDLAEVLPPGLLERIREGLQRFDRRLPGFAASIGQLIGVETRTSSPVRIVRDEETLQTVGVAGLYPCGEGAGYAGGIVSAALDGRRVASAIVAGTDGFPGSGV